MTTAERTPAARAGRLRVPRGLARLRAAVLTERHPALVDLVTALGILVLTALPQRHELHATPWLWALQVALVMPLALRRRAPFPVFAAISLAALLQWATGHPMPADAAVLLALYTVAAHCRRRLTLIAYGIAELGVVMALLRWPPLGEHGDRTHLPMWLRVFVLFSGTVLAAVALGRGGRARRAQLTALRQRARDLEHQRDQQAALAVAEERSRIAREMHDIVTHNLSVMVALADAAAYANATAPDKATDAMRRSAETGRQALTDMRRFLGVLRADEPDALRHPQPGIGQLAVLAEHVRAAGLPTELHVSGEPAAVSPGAQLTAYRLVQESLTNTLKHAAPGARARVTVHAAPAAVTLEIRDDGRPTAAAPGLGQGLAGMRERVAAYGGHLTAGPAPGGGWRVAATLHLDDHSPRAENDHPSNADEEPSPA
ncbi:DUF7134 domain-containing protein [Kitasatospora sp. NPDC001660]